MTEHNVPGITERGRAKAEAEESDIYNPSKFLRNHVGEVHEFPFPPHKKPR